MGGNRWKSRFETVLYWIEGLPLLVAGLIGIYVVIAHHLGLHRILSGKEVPLTLAISALLALALGIERFTRWKKIEARLDATQNALRQVQPIRFLEGIDVFEEAIVLAQSAKRSIKAVVYESETIESATVSKAIATHLEAHPNIRFDVVLITSATIDAAFWDIHSQRFESYKSNKVQGHVFRYIVTSANPSGFDTLIIDDLHVGISFSPFATGQQSKQIGISLWNQKALGPQLGDWFNNSFLTGANRATPYADAEERWRKKQNAAMKAEMGSS